MKLLQPQPRCYLTSLLTITRGARKEMVFVASPSPQAPRLKQSRRMEGSSKDEHSSTNLDQPLSKRPRLDDVVTAADEEKGEEEENKLVELLVDGEDFITDEERQKAEAERRRQQRRLRLQHLEAKKEEEELMNVETAPVTTQHLAEGPDKMETKPARKEQKSRQSDDDDDDDDDMFSSSVSPVVSNNNNNKKGASAGAGDTKRGHEQTDWDDVEGYYKAVIGETITLKTSAADDSREGIISLRVAGVIGKGVFSTVLKCTTISNSSSTELPPTVALKCIRNNETMAKAALSEMQTLQRVKGCPGIVPLLLPTNASPLEHRGHVILLFNFMQYNLRDVLHKFGKGVGLSLHAVRSYFGQLLAAATHLQKHGIIHADLKPDNCLVSNDFGVVQLADFGSAVLVNSPEQAHITPYMVSRFYRAPEIILGLTPTHAIDLWSLAVTVAELFLGDVVFRGKSNNDMLHVHMQHLGAFPNRVIRQHLVQCQRLAVPRHFEQEGANYVFRQQTVDPVTGAPVHKILSLLPQNNDYKFPMGTPLRQKLLKAKSANDSRKMVLEFSDLLHQCFALDPSRRIALKEALRHPFFVTTKVAEASKSKNSTKYS